MIANIKKNSVGVWGALIAFAVLARYVYYALAIIFFNNNPESASGGFYSFFLMLFAGICFLFFLRQLILNKERMPHSSIIVVLLSLLLMLSLLVEQSVPANDYNALTYYAVMAFPLLLAGCSFGIEKDKETFLLSFFRALIIIMVLLTAAVVLYQLRNMSEGWSSRDLSDISYQTASYMGALAFGLNCASFCVKDQKFDSKLILKLFTVLRVILLPIQAICVFISGGRGGAVLVFLFGIVSLLILTKDRKRTLRILGTIATVVLLGFVVLSFLSVDQLESSVGFQRILSFRDNRSYLYEDAISLFLEQPFFGYGTAGYYALLGMYCHNFVLDVLLNWGLVLGVLFCALVIWAYLQVWKVVSTDLSSVVLIFLGLFSIVHLMVSSTYLVDSIFWFMLGAGVSLKPIKNVRSR